MKTRKTIITAILLSAVLLGSLLVPVFAAADSLYIIPDSDTRALTYDELWEYRYDTLLYAFNEIYARHGYKFETGSRCYNWFNQMPWYHANESESSSNHHEAYSQCSTIENRNVDLIKAVRRDMRDQGVTNKGGIGMPKPPAANVNKPRGFEYVDLAAKQKLPVFTAPSIDAYRANNGKATCSTNGAVYGLGWENGWMLMLYEANHAGQYRVGYIWSPKIKKGAQDNLGQLGWDGSSCEVLETVNVTDDPALTGNTLTTVYAGQTVVYLTTMYNDGAWDYVETTIDGRTARGFVPSGSLSITSVDLTEKDGNG
jgi:hypothetical protein